MLDGRYEVTVDGIGRAALGSEWQVIYILQQDFSVRQQAVGMACRVYRYSPYPAAGDQIADSRRKMAGSLAECCGHAFDLGYVLVRLHRTQMLQRIVPNALVI